MDVEDIAPGQPFARTIDDTIAHCDTALIVIGPRWAEILKQRAQEQQIDYVRREIEAALAQKITIVPVLVGAASAAELEGLPGRLSELGQYEATELRDNTFSDDCARLTKSLRLQTLPPAARAAKSFRLRPALLPGIALLIILLVAASAWLRIGPIGEYRNRKAAIAQMLATAKTQVDRGEYESSFKTYQELLKTDPGNRLAMERQVDAAMAWLDDFHVIPTETVSAESLAAGRLDEIMPVLDAGLARANGQRPRAADILAHLGWAHWLNQKLAQREFGSAAEQNLRQALQTDPSNVYANAMLGNWLMQTGGSTEDALKHFRTAVETNQARPLVRQMELGVLVYPEDTEARVALIRLANEMRRNDEPIEDHERGRILSAYDPTVNSEAEITQTLSAVAPDDAWATYLWLDRSMPHSAADYKRVQADFIHASIMEEAGKRDDALKAFGALRSELKKRDYNGRIADYTDKAIQRLTAH